MTVVEIDWSPAVAFVRWLTGASLHIAAVCVAEITSALSRRAAETQTITRTGNNRGGRVFSIHAAELAGKHSTLCEAFHKAEDATSVVAQ